MVVSKKQQHAAQLEAELAEVSQIIADLETDGTKLESLEAEAKAGYEGATIARDFVAAAKFKGTMLALAETLADLKGQVEQHRSKERAIRSELRRAQLEIEAGQALIDIEAAQAALRAELTQLEPVVSQTAKALSEKLIAWESGVKRFLAAGGSLAGTPVWRYETGREFRDALEAQGFNVRPVTKSDPRILTGLHWSLRRDFDYPQMSVPVGAILDLAFTVKDPALMADLSRLALEGKL